MILFAHRGNTNGPNPDDENKPSYLEKALTNGYCVETDVWIDPMFNQGYNVLYLGHDVPQYKVTLEFLKNPKIVCHAKTVKTFMHLLEHEDIHCFMYEDDDCYLTSKGFLWINPKFAPTLNIMGDTSPLRSVCVMPEQAFDRNDMVKMVDKQRYRGVCSDYVSLFAESQ